MSASTPADLLPHSGRAVLLDEIVGNDQDGFASVAHITAAHPFFVPGKGVPAWVGMELMAQAIAVGARAGTHAASHTPRGGMLLGTRRYRSKVAWFAEGARLIVHTERTFGHDGGIAACQCTIECDGRTVAESTIIIVEETAA